MSETRIPEILNDYDWAEAFAYAGDEESYLSVRCRVHPAIPGGQTPTSPFGRKDVKRVVALSEGEKDGPSWLCVGELYDGRYFALKASCDYTGWD